MSHSSQRNRTVRPRYSFLDVPLLIIRNLLSWVSKVLSVDLGRQSERGTTNERVLCAREFDADQVPLEGK